MKRWALLLTSSGETEWVQPIDLARLEREEGARPGPAVEVLVVGTDDWAIDDATAKLEAAGRTVHRCSDSTQWPFPCNALVPGRGCPLVEHEVDVVLDVHSSGGTSEPTLPEMGALCGLRDGKPLVVAGMTETAAFAPWAEVVPPTGDIVSCCDEAVRSRV